MSEEYPIPTPEERAAEHKALMEKHPTAKARFELMFGEVTEPKPDILQTIREILEENAFIQDGNDLDPNITFQELNMDSLDITKLVVEVEGRFGVSLDTENTWPTTVAELIALIQNQLGH